MNCKCNHNYYIDENGLKYPDIPLNTTAEQAYVRTNLKIKEGLQNVKKMICNAETAFETDISQIKEDMDTTKDIIIRNVNDWSENLHHEILSIGNRVDNIIAHNNDTESNSELIDIRTGTDGTIYTSAGNAVRSQLQTLERAFELIESDNKLNLDTITENTIINASGVETTNDTCYTSDFIKAAPGDVVILALKKDSTLYHAGVKLTKVSMYNQNHQFISASVMNIQDFTITEQNTAFIRVSVPNGTLNYDIVSVTLNTVPTSASITEYFTPYYSSEGVSEETKRSRRVLWLGTSIPTYGYPQILGRLCGATIFNESIGSSGIAKGVNANITQSNVCGIRGKYGLYSLCQTVQEKQYMIDHWETIASELGTSDELTTDIINQSLASSYETILDPYLTGNNAVNLIVLNHAYNDSSNETDVLVSDDPFDTHTLEGAYNWTIRHILQANPHIGIVIFGHYSDLPGEKETALNKVAERWNIPYYKLKNDLGWSAEAISTTQKIGMDGEWTNISETTMQIRNMWCADGIHPIGKASNKIAQVSVPTFKNWLTMYCGS